MQMKFKEGTNGQKTLSDQNIAGDEAAAVDWALCWGALSSLGSKLYGKIMGENSKTHLSVAVLDSAGCSYECRVPSSHRRCCDCTASLAPTTNEIHSKL